MAKYFTVYNYENFTIGFAPALRGSTTDLKAESGV